MSDRAQDSRDRAVSMRAFEDEAELIFVHTLDLMAQLEAQLRAVRHTLLSTDKLRAVKHRVGPLLTNGQRDATLVILSDEIAAVDKELFVQHQSCLDMQRSIRAMQARLQALKARLLSDASGDKA
jgi:phosphoglycerate-specific signal transduction histidine kinase